NGTTNTLTATYAYDVHGERVQEDKWVTGGITVTTRFAFTLGREVWAELDGSNTVTARYLSGDGEVQVFERTDVGGTSRVWLLADRLGSIRDVASTTQVLDHVEFKAYGEIASETNSANGINRLYTGLYQDRDTHIVFMDRRTLLVTSGQWMQEDPITFEAGDA